MPVIKENCFTEVDINTNQTQHIPEVESDSNDLNFYAQNSNAGKFAGAAHYNSDRNVITANTPVHVPDISEVSYSDFILYNYGQVYQRQHYEVVADKLKPV